MPDRRVQEGVLILFCLLLIEVQSAGACEPIYPPWDRSSQVLNWPYPTGPGGVGNGRFTSPFGPRWKSAAEPYDFHEGVDIGDGADTPRNVKAVHDGLVIRDTQTGYGNLVHLFALDANNDAIVQSTRYCHLTTWDDYNAPDSSIVTAGTILGTSGNTGVPGFPIHLHFEYWECYAWGDPPDEDFIRLGSNCKKPPTEALYRPDSSDPTVAITENVSGAIGVTVTISRDEMDLKSLELSTAVSGQATTRGTVCMWPHLNAGDRENTNAQNGDDSQVENLGGGNTLTITPTDVIDNWQVTYRFAIPGHEPSQAQICASVSDFSGPVFSAYQGFAGMGTEAFCEMNIDPPATPAVFVVKQNHPNPFNPATMYEFVVPRPDRARAVAYNTAGRAVATLLDAPLEEGPHELAWSGTDRDGRALPSGVYYVVIRVGGEQKTVQSVILR